MRKIGINIYIVILIILLPVSSSSQVSKEVKVIQDIFPSIFENFLFLRSEIQNLHFPYIYSEDSVRIGYDTTKLIELIESFKFTQNDTETVLLFVFDTLYPLNMFGEPLPRRLVRDCEKIIKDSICCYPCDSSLFNTKTKKLFAVIDTIKVKKNIILKSKPDWVVCEFAKTLPIYGMRNIGCVAFSRVYFNNEEDKALLMCGVTYSSHFLTYTFFLKLQNEVWVVDDF